MCVIAYVVKYMLITSQVDEKGQINSLSTVLSQEVDRFNNLLKVLKVQTSMDVYMYIHVHGWCAY